MAIDAFLKIDGIPGESVDAKHKGEIDVLAFSWGVSQAGSAGSGGGGGAGKAVFDDLLVVAHTSKASPLLWQACASGKHVKSAVLTCRRPGKSPVEFLKITLTDVLVASYELDGSDDEPAMDVPAGQRPIEIIMIRCNTDGPPVDVEMSLDEGPWLPVGDQPSSPDVGPFL